MNKTTANKLKTKTKIWHLRKYQLMKNLKVSHSRTFVFTDQPNLFEFNLRKLEYVKNSTLKVRYILPNISV